MQFLLSHPLSRLLRTCRLPGNPRNSKAPAATRRRSDAPQLLPCAAAAPGRPAPWRTCGDTTARHGRRVRCGVVWCGTVRCNAVQCGALRCGATKKISLCASWPPARNNRSTKRQRWSRQEMAAQDAGGWGSCATKIECRRVWGAPESSAEVAARWAS